MKKNIIILLCLIMIGTCGCSEIKTDSPSAGEYATQNKISALEYGIYMNKQITVYINQISTRMGVCRNISKGYKTDNETALAEESVNIMQDILDEVTVTNPSVSSDDDRKMTITAMETALEHMKGYAKAVEDGKEVDGYIKDFENDFNQLTGLANLYYQ